jgi:hypothetical protein
MKTDDLKFIQNTIQSAIKFIVDNTDSNKSGIKKEILRGLRKSRILLINERMIKTQRVIIKSPHKDATRIIWDKTDTFHTIYLKLKNLTGLLIINKKDESTPFTVFEVENIKKTRVNASFVKKAPLVWGFRVHYGIIDVTGSTMSNSYQFTIPRTCNNFKKDLNKYPLMFDENHPFIFYKLKK